MASSRWRRFAFFDRSTLSLPEEVYQDLIPLNSDIGINKNKNQSNETVDGSTSLGDTNGVIPPPSVLFQDEVADASNVHSNSIYSLNPENLPPTSEYFSICSVSIALGNDPRKASTSPGPTKNPKSTQPNNVIASALASYGVGGAISPSYDSNGRTTFMHPSSSAAVNMSMAMTGGTNAMNKDSVWRVPVGSQLVLLFLASRNSQRLHVIDLTMRCNPTYANNHGGLKSTLGDDNRSNILESGDHDHDLEDLDGWRGSFFPFQEGIMDPPNKQVNETVEQQIISQHLSNQDVSDDLSSECKGRILGVAACTSVQDQAHVVIISDYRNSVGVCVHIDPHLYLQPTTTTTETTMRPMSQCVFQPGSTFDFKFRGKPRCVDISPGANNQYKVAVGTDRGVIIIYTYTYSPPPDTQKQQKLQTQQHQQTHAGSAGNGSGGNLHLQQKMMKLAVLQELPPPTAGGEDSDVVYSVTRLKISGDKLYACYKRRVKNNQATPVVDISTGAGDNNGRSGSGADEERMRPTGVCCYNLSKGGKSVESRFDLDGRDVISGAICDLDGGTGNLVVARSDGLYAYSSKDRNGVAPIDGSKIAMCCLPSHVSYSDTISMKQIEEEKKSSEKEENSSLESSTTLSNYVLIAAKDSKSGRDVVDIYDANNKLVAFHVLLSPGHKALQSSAVITGQENNFLTSMNEKFGRSSAIVLTSGGAIVTLTEKSTASKVALLTQKNLYSAAITLAYQDPSYSPSDITSLYRRHAEHLYRKGDFESAIDQYIFTVGSLEPSHVIFRYLDAPKIPLLAKYLEVLREKKLATGIHLDLLRTCYLKLNDSIKAENVGVERTKKGNFGTGFASAVTNLSHNPTESLAMICSFEAPQAAEALVVHGATLARALPRETAGLVLSLCDGTFSPNAFADATDGNAVQDNDNADDKKNSKDTTIVASQRYPVEMFSFAFLENPKLLRLILTHCNKQKCEMSPSLRRTLLELTIEEWNSARRHGDVEKERVRRNQALALLTDSNTEEIGDYEALVIVQLAGFTEGEVLLYERLQMAPMLLERYAKDGGERARRQMLAMCRTDPELLADVLGYFVSMASERISQDHQNDDESQDSEGEAILDDIQEALDMARAQGVLPPVQIARILAGEGVGQFSTNEYGEENAKSVPLSVALDYVGNILDDESAKIERIQAEVEEYNNSCDAMEAEIKRLLTTNAMEKKSEMNEKSNESEINVQDLYNTLKESLEGEGENNAMNAEEEFWREMEHSEDRFETIARFYSRGIIP